MGLGLGGVPSNLQFKQFGFGFGFGFGLGRATYEVCSPGGDGDVARRRAGRYYQHSGDGDVARRRAVRRAPRLVWK